MDINQKLTEELEVKRWQVDAAVKLIDEGNTIPFISRYRKEATGSLNDEQLRKLHERLVYLRNLEEKKEQVLSSIEEQGKLTEELFESYLDTAGIPDPDLLIRTSGEQRLSNYLLWQLAYSEFYFTDVPWPDFGKEELEKAVEAYNKRDRRFGGLAEEAK